MDDLGVLNSLIARARRRMLLNLVWEQLSTGAAAALAGAILLLLLGTDLLASYWLAILFGGGAAFSAWRTFRRLPSPYAVAQEIDRRLGLHDAVSTALHFCDENAAKRFSPDVVQWQRAQATEFARGADAAAAAPWKLPRQAFAMAGLAVAVVTLVGIRYGIIGSLDLHQPMVSVSRDLFQTSRQTAEAKARAEQHLTETALQEQDPDVIQAGEPTGEKVQATKGDMLYDSNSTSDPALARQAQPLGASTESEEGKQTPAKGESPSEQSSKQGNNTPDPASTSGESANPDGQSKQQNGQQQNASLMDKMRDAMANLMSKLKPQPQNGQSAQSQSSQTQSLQQKNDNSKGGQKGSPSDAQQQEGSTGADSESNAESSTEIAKGGKGQGQGQGADSNGDTDQSNGGIGRQDGSKQLREAQQLKAMGKLTELFGQRAKNVTGEVLVEVTSGKQQELRTAYSDRGASHGEAGGEIHRDEIPLQFQQYVQQYFEQVRKGESGAGKTSGAQK